MHRSRQSVHHHAQQTRLAAAATADCLNSFAFVTFTKTNNLASTNLLGLVSVIDTFFFLNLFKLQKLNIF